MAIIILVEDYFLSVMSESQEVSLDNISLKIISGKLELNTLKLPFIKEKCPFGKPA